VSVVLLSAVKIGKARKNNLKILAKGLFLIIILGGLTLLTFYVFNGMVVRFLIGKKYLFFAEYLFKLGVLSFLASIINLVFVYFFALRNKLIIFPAIVAPLFVLVLVIFNHNSIADILTSFIFGSVFVLIFLIYLLYAEVVKKEKN
jgi:hypothetical protein